jgi:NAD(P)-dependent dehydrogenase (short-subunit alcohol dehydrogenase family)
VEDLSAELWQQCFSVNVEGVFLCAPLLAPSGADTSGGALLG